MILCHNIIFLINGITRHDVIHSHFGGEVPSLFGVLRFTWMVGNSCYISTFCHFEQDNQNEHGKKEQEK